MDLSKYAISSINNCLSIGAQNGKLAKENYKSAKKGEFSLNLGGDHSIATGSIFGLKEAFPSLKVVWVDAHADCNTAETSPSGNYHGMPLSPVLGLMKKGTIPGFDWCYPNLKFSDLVYIGLRHLDEGEKVVIAENNIKTYDMNDVTGLGIG